MELRVAVLRFTQVMRSRLLGESLRIVDQPVFACPVPTSLDWKLRRRYLVVFIDRLADSTQDQIIGLGIVIPGNRATSYERRIEVEDFAALPTPAPTDGLKARLKEYADALSADGPLTPGRARHLVEALAQEFPTLARRLRELQERIAVPVPTGDAVGNSLGQRDSTNVLLTAFNMDPAPIRNWPASTSSADYYQNIPGNALPHEDDLIRNLRSVSGWDEQSCLASARTNSLATPSASMRADRPRSP